MIIRSSTFVGSFTGVDGCPISALPEFAFIGRSNVGKSSLINMLCNKKDMVKTSGTPGKTQLLNFFLINDDCHFVDLPGYGFAKVSKDQRKSWVKMIRDYLSERGNLACAFQLIDSRLAPQKIDLDFTNLLGEWNVPFALAYTKSDKSGPLQASMHMQQYHERMKESWETLPSTFITSAETKIGTQEIFSFIEATISRYKKERR